MNHPPRIAGFEVVETTPWCSPRYEVVDRAGQRFTILAAGETCADPPKFAERAARLAAHGSPHLVRCLSHGNDPLVGPYLRFAPLSLHSLHKLWPRTFGAVRDAIDGALRGLHEAHRLGLYHGELTTASFGHGATGMVFEDVFTLIMRGTERPVWKDLRTMGLIVFELLAGRPYDPSPEASEPPSRSLALAAAVQTAIRNDPPTRFADAEAMRNALLFALDRVERFAPRDPVEARFLDGLRSGAADDELRRVYADWLEQHGHDEQAVALRDANLSVVGTPSTPAWRALISRSPIYGCAGRCTKSWDQLQATVEDTVRRCSSCDHSVHYCTDHDEAHARVDEGMRVATDRDTMSVRAPSINLIRPQGLPRAAQVVALPMYDDVLTPYVPPGQAARDDVVTPYVPPGQAARDEDVVTPYVPPRQAAQDADVGHGRSRTLLGALRDWLRRR